MAPDNTSDRRILIKGDIVRVRKEGSADEWCSAIVEIASTLNPELTQSVGLRLSGIVRDGEGVVFGAIPLLVNYKAGTVESLMGGTYEIEVQGSQATFSPA